MPGLFEAASRLSEELTKLKEDRNRLVTENKIVHASEIKLFDLRTNTSFNVGSLQKLMARVDATKRDLKKA